MPSITAGNPPQSVLTGANHVLYFEGALDGLDVKVLKQVIPGAVGVKPLGPCFSLSAVAEALHAHNPEWWFVIDRDHWTDERVEQSWRSFPDPATKNLLIWRRKELENYFLDPTWLAQGRYLKSNVTPSDVEDWLVKEARHILLLEAANRVLRTKREKVKGARMSLLKAGDLQGLDRAGVVQKLSTCPLISSLRTAAGVVLTDNELEAAFNEEITLLSNGLDPMEWGQGRWRDLMSGKELFHSMINQWCVVPDEARGRKARLVGPHAERAVAVDLLKNHQDGMPQDFKDLKAMLEKLTR